MTKEEIKAKRKFTREELLKDFVSYHYMEGVITKDQGRVMTAVIKEYLRQIDEILGKP